MTHGSEWTVERVYSNVHIVRFENIKAGWNHKVLLTGDRHHDNLHTDHQLEKRHLDKAKESNAPIIDIGDFFCLMQGKFDPRKSYTDLRPELTDGPYLDRVIDTAEEFYAPYADQFVVIGQGNHEASVLKRNETDMTKRITGRLKRHAKKKNRSNAGGYSGWILFRLGGLKKSKSQTILLKYHHGYGGGGPVTKGVIQTNRRAVYLPDADIIVTGHIHESWVVPIKRERISQRGVIHQDYQWHVSVPTYKDEYDRGQDGFHIWKGRPPKPLGCAWLTLSYEKAIIKPSLMLDLV